MKIKWKAVREESLSEIKKKLEKIKNLLYNIYVIKKYEDSLLLKRQLFKTG